MYKIIAIDLDETLYANDYTICQRNRVALQKAKELGIKIVPCSGRTPGLLTNLYEELDIDNDNEYSILGNGSIVINNKSADVLHCEPMSFEKAKELFLWGRSHHYPVEIYTAKKVYFFAVDNEEKEIAKMVGNIDFLEDDQFSSLENKEILKVIYLIRKQSERELVTSQLKDLCEGNVTISSSSNRYLEFNRYGIHKGIGLQALAEHLHIPMDETIAIGDNFNDMQLLQHAGLGVAMQNAIQPLKDIANYVCESDNNQGGVAEAIEKFILKKES